MTSLGLTLLVLIAAWLFLPGWWWLALVMLVVSAPISLAIAIDNARLDRSGPHLQAGSESGAVVSRPDPA